jgi:MSHA biogenesis protein MshM
MMNKKDFSSMISELKEHFQLKELPFELTPDLRYFCHLDGSQLAIDTITCCIDKGDAIIKVVGEVGSGKTMLCRKLIAEFDQYGYQTLYIHNPMLTELTLLRLIADELSLAHTEQDSEYRLHKLITEKLLALHIDQKRVVLFVDEAQTLSDQSLEAIRLLTNLESETQKLIQIVLFGQPELDDNLSKQNLRQLKQRISFSYVLPPLRPEDADHYIARRLVSSGHQTGHLFSSGANELLYKASKGTPRVINILAYKSLLSSYAMGKKSVDVRSARSAIRDSSDILSTLGQENKKDVFFWLTVVGLFILIGGMVGFLLIG